VAKCRCQGDVAEPRGCYLPPHCSGNTSGRHRRRPGGWSYSDMQHNTWGSPPV